MHGIQNLRLEFLAAFFVYLFGTRQRHFFNWLTGGFFDVTQHAFFTATHEHNSLTITAGTTGTADTVHVRFGIGRNIVVNDVTDAFYVQTTGCHVSRHNNIELTGFQFFHGFFAQRLRNITVQR